MEKLSLLSCRVLLALDIVGIYRHIMDIILQHVWVDFSNFISLFNK